MHGIRFDRRQYLEFRGWMLVMLSKLWTDKESRIPDIMLVSGSLVAQQLLVGFPGFYPGPLLWGALPKRGPLLF